MDSASLIGYGGITFIATGGTIDKSYSPRAGTTDLEIGNPAIERILAKVPSVLNTKIWSALQKDSTEITGEDREKIYQLCIKAPTEHIIITHGTDSIVETARYLHNQSGLKEKVIILTGASKPEMFKDSDAAFNVGVAVGAVQRSPPDIYIALCGYVFPWDDCKKDKRTGLFIKAKDQ